MGLFSKFRADRPPKNTDSARYKRWMAAKINEKHIRYLTERCEDGERVIGRDGFISVVGDELVVTADGVDKFRTPVTSMSAWEFMSLQGVTITGFDAIAGRVRTVAAYYSYHR